MLGPMILEVFIQAAVLCTILYVVARYEADYSFQKVAMVAAGIGLGNMLIQSLLQPHVPVGLQSLLVIPCIIFTAFMIMTFCWINVWKSVLVVLVFVGFQLLSHLGMQVLMKRFGSSDAQAAAVEKKQQEVAEMQEQIVAMIENPAAPAPAVPPPAPTVAPEPAPVPESDKPVAPGPAVNDVGWDAAEKMLKVAGVSKRHGEVIALVNNSVVLQNGVIRVTYNGMIYSWRAAAISSDGVRWERLKARPVSKPAPRGLPR